MDLAQLEKISIVECEEPLVDLARYDFLLEPVYFKQGLALDDKMMIRESVAEKLLTARQSLPGEYNFKIWDAYRTIEVQKKLFDSFTGQLRSEHSGWTEDKIREHASCFVCSPDARFIPGHLTGGALDLTLVDKEGNELVMGTDFDEFVEKANTYHFDGKQSLTEEEEICKANRILLRSALIKEDFAPYPFEWWHFNFGNQAWAHDKGKEFAIYGDANKFCKA